MTKPAKSAAKSSIATTAPVEQCPYCGCTATKIFAKHPAIITHEPGCEIAEKAALKAPWKEAADGYALPRRFTNL
jgi:RNA polymerase subunit RPABC4/transcription elongation factor Spt4